MRAQLLDASGTSIAGLAAKPASLEVGRTAEVVLEGAVAAPRRWSAESPALYTLIVSLLD